MRGSGKAENYLLLVFTSDRGLCGSYNSNVAREASKRIEELLGGGKNVKILCIGKKGRDILKRKYAGMIVDTIEGIARKGAKYYEAVDLGQRVLDMYAKGEFDVCETVSSRFRSAINREIVVRQVFPVQIEDFEYNRLHAPVNVYKGAFYDYEPGLLEILGRPSAASFPQQPVSGDCTQSGIRTRRAHDFNGQRHPQCQRHDFRFNPAL